MVSATDAPVRPATRPAGVTTVPPSADRPSSARRTLRVVHALDGFGVGGTELNLVRTLEQIDRERFDLALVTLTAEGPLRARFDATGVPITEFALRNMYGPAAWRTGWRLARWLRATGTDVVHCHDSYSNIFSAFWARVAGVRVVVTSRRWLVPSGGRAYAVANRLANRAATAVLANSPAVARLVVDEGVRSARVVTVPNFLEDEAFALLEAPQRALARQRLGVPDEALVIGVVAQLRPVKSLETLVAAMARLVPRFPSLHLVLVGDGPSRTRLASDAQALGIAGRVHFPGRLENRPNLHQLFDVSVLCSVYEGFPNTLVEAMAVGTPIVATRTGGVPDAVRHEENGLLVPPRDPARLADAIAALLTDAERRRAFGEAGRRRATAEFHVSHVLPQLEQMYERLHREGKP